MIVDTELFNRCFEDFTSSAWRFEGQPTYTMPREQPGVARFLAGKPKPPDHNEGWHGRIRNWAAAGKTINRVRTVRRPLTDYQRYQFAWTIPGNMDAGEDVRVLDLTERELDLPTQDFWIFDESLVVQLNFRPDGTLINREKQEDSILDQYLAWQETALKHSVPFSEWNAGT